MKDVLAIGVICSNGVTDYDVWAKSMVDAFGQDTANLPDELRSYVKIATAPAADAGGVAILHAVAPVDAHEVFGCALEAASSGAKTAGACIATVDASSPTDYLDDLDVFRRLHNNRDTGPEVREALSNIHWVEARDLASLPDEPRKDAFKALMLFSELLDAKFFFAKDIASYLQARKGN